MTKVKTAQPAISNKKIYLNFNSKLVSAPHIKAKEIPTAPLNPP